MTAIVILTLLLLIALAGPLYGVDTRSSSGWNPVDGELGLWPGAGQRSTR